MEEKLKLIPLKQICRPLNLEPRKARRILRANRKRPKGRWAWKVKEARAIATFLEGEIK